MIAASRIGLRWCPRAERIPLVDSLILKLAEEEEEQPSGEVLKHGQCLILAGIHVGIDVHQEADICQSDELREIFDACSRAHK